jgi:gliding motility-associated-like protein
MGKFSKFLILLLVLLAGGSKDLKSTHMMGADITYQCLGNGKYKIISKIYRDCRGVSFNNPTFGAFAGTNGGNGCGSVNLSGMTRTSIRDVTTRCSSSSNPCNPSNTYGTGKGVEEHTYEAEVDFGRSPLNQFVGKSSCCEITFYVGQCCRNGAITTGASNADFYTTCMINICNIQKTDKECNSSPQLSNEPVGFLCCNTPWYYNNGAIDTVDFDSISYRLVKGIRGLPNTAVNYSSPFDERYFMTPFCIPPSSTNIKCAPNVNVDPPRGLYFDTSNGDIITTPIKCDEVPIIVIEQTEHRKDTNGVWVVIGRTRRDMQMWVIDECGYNKPPIIRGPFSWNICEGEKICKKIRIDDETFTPHQTVPDTVLGTWNAGIPGATFEVVDPTQREKEYEFCWETKVGDASDVSYTFTVRATDQHCTPPMISIRSFKVKVNPKATTERKYDTLKCGRFAFSSVLPGGFKGTPSYQWSVRDSSGAKELKFSARASDTMNYYYGGRYIVVHTINNSFNCPTIYRDTVDLPQPPTVILAELDSFACFGSTFKLSPTILAGKSPFRYRWNTGDTTEEKEIKNFKQDTTLLLEITDSDGCKFSDTVFTPVKPLPVVKLGPDKVICTYDSVRFDAQHSDTMFYLWSTGDTTRSIIANFKGDYSVTVTDTIYRCEGHDTVYLTVNDTVTSIAGDDQAVCDRDTFRIKASHSPSNLQAQYQWIGTNGLPQYDVVANIKNSPYQYILRTTISQNGISCVDFDTTEIVIKPLPVLSWQRLDPRCYDFGNIWLETRLNRPNTLGTIDIWSGTLKNKQPPVYQAGTNPPFNQRFAFDMSFVDNNKLQGGNNISFKIYGKFTDTNGCSNIDSTVQVVNGTPLIKLFSKQFCQDLGEIDLFKEIVDVPKNKAGNKMTWSVIDYPGPVNKDLLLVNKNPFGTADWWFRFGAPNEDFYEGKYKFRLCVENILTGCFACDTTEIEIIPEPEVVIETVPDFCVNSGEIIDLLKYTKVNGQKATGGSFRIIAFDGNTNDARTKTVIDSGKFDPSMGAGIYDLEYKTSQMGCEKVNTFTVFVNDTPDLKLNEMRFCSTYGFPFDLKGISTLGSRNVTKILYPEGETFTPTWNAGGYDETPYRIMLVGENIHGCKDTEWTNLLVFNQPRVKIIPPFVSCGKDTFIVKLDTLYAKDRINIRFTFNTSIHDTLIPPSGEVIGDTRGFGEKRYIPSSQDTADEYFYINFKTWGDPNWVGSSVCSTDFSDSIRIIITPYPEPDFITENGCQPHTLSFTPINNQNISKIEYDWSINDTFSNQTNSTWTKKLINEGRYRTTLSAVNTTHSPKICATAITKTFEVYPNPEADFITDPAFKTTIALPRFRVSNQTRISQVNFSSSIGYKWSWGKDFEIGRDTVENPVIIFSKDTGTYWITLFATTDKGCVDSAMRIVSIGPDIIVFIPDVFTPDGQGPNTNNTFQPEIINNRTFNMMIYNRWGAKMYETSSLAKGWDGTYLGSPVPQGVYVYKILVTSMEDKIYTYSGTVTLLR